MIHLPYNPNDGATFTTLLFEGVQPWTGQQGQLKGHVVSLDTGLTYDHASSDWESAPADPDFDVTVAASRSNLYLCNLPSLDFPRGYYQLIVEHGATGEAWTVPFSVGMAVNRKLGYTAGYDGANLTLALWVEEDGVKAEGYTELRDVVIKDGADGSTLADGTIGTISPSGGLFLATEAVDLPEGGIFVLEATARTTKVNGTRDFKLVAGLSRP